MSKRKEAEKLIGKRVRFPHWEALVLGVDVHPVGNVLSGYIAGAKGKTHVLAFKLQVNGNELLVQVPPRPKKLEVLK